MLNARYLAVLVSLIFLFIWGCAQTQTQVKKSVKPSKKEIQLYSDVITGSEMLAEDLIKVLDSTRPGYRPKIAVVDFLGPGNNHTALGRLVSQKLITHFVRIQRFENVLERHLFWQLLQQQQFEMTGYFDPKTVSEVAGKIGMQAMVTGVITEMGNLLDINARIVDYKGNILSAAEIQLPKVDMAQEILTADLRITVQPANPGVKIAVGDSMVDAAQGSAVFRDVPQGNRSIIVSGYDVEVIQKNIYLNRDSSLTIPIKFKTTSMTLRVSPRNAIVMLDGGSKAPDSEGHVRFPSLSFGEHRLVVKAPCHQIYDQTIHLESNKSFDIVLQKSCAEVTFKLTPPNAQVSFDNIPRQVAQGVAIIPNVPYGSHSIRMAANGYVTHEQIIEINSDMTLPFELVEDRYDSIVSHLVSLNNQNSRFNIDLWVNNTSFRIGEMITFSFKANRDCYLTLVNIPTDGSLNVIFPNSFHRNNFVRAGKVYTIPDASYGFDFEVQGPRGIDQVKAIASEEPLRLFAPDYNEGPVYSATRGNTDAVRTVVPILKRLEMSAIVGAASDEAGWAEAQIEFMVH